MQATMKSKFFFLFILSFVYSIFSYALTDPNLVITSWAPYWQFQQWIWEVLFKNPMLLTSIYTVLIIGFFSVYFCGIRYLQTEKAENRYFFLHLILALSPLFLSYNALSHDVFNYMFNAKMVVLFQANPHIQTALEFGSDTWTRFMHNTHTPAPYGYGWTVFSLIPYSLGFHKFLPTWFIFKALAWISYFLLFIALKKLTEKLGKKSLSVENTWLIFANPLLFIEILSNLHNDLWMLVPAVFSLVFILKKPAKNLWLSLFLSALFLGFSISTKLATIVLLPFWIFWAVNWIPRAASYFASLKNLSFLFPFFISVALFIPLFTIRSQQFLPWYLLWSLIWLPFTPFLSWKKLIVALSLSSLLRYLPWLWTGGFDGSVISDQKMITWVGGGLFFLLISFFFSSHKQHKTSKETS